MSDTSRKLFLGPISPAAGAPLYQQVVEGIRGEVRRGRLKPGTSLPSFRALAAELKVSLITVKRAYEELEREGLIFRKQGMGTFVAENALALGRAGMLSEVRERVDAAWSTARGAGLTEEEFQEIVRETLDTTKTQQ